MRNYWPMLAAADQLAQFEGYLSTDGLKQRNEARHRFNLQVKAFVHSALKEVLCTEDLIQSVNDDIDTYVTENGGTEDFSTATIREAVLARIQIDSGRPAWLRNSIRWAPVVIGALAVIAYITVRLTSSIEITSSVESREGIEQRAAAVGKVINYDEMMGTHSVRGGWLKEMFLWPVKPTAQEIAGASEFVDLTLSGYDFLAEQRAICPTLPENVDQNLSREQIALIKAVAEDVRQPDRGWQARPVDTVLEIVRSKFPC